MNCAGLVWLASKLSVRPLPGSITSSRKSPRSLEVAKFARFVVPPSVEKKALVEPPDEVSHTPAAVNREKIKTASPAMRPIACDSSCKNTPLVFVEDQLAPIPSAASFRDVSFAPLGAPEKPPPLNIPNALHVGQLGEKLVLPPILVPAGKLATTELKAAG